MPPLLRSKKYPYGLPGLSHHHKDECNIGTILMARAIGMVDAVHRADRCAKVPSFATLENPPPSDHEEHISAWHMPEMVELVDRIDDWKCAHFNMCAYGSDFPLGTKHYKPQMVGGTLPGICSLNRVCTCGNKTHEPIVGKDKSSKSAAYPWEFCQAYGELAARHFMKHGKDGVLGREIDTSGGPHYLPQGECGRCHERGREPGGAHQDRREIFSSQKRAGAQEEEGGRARRNGGGERLRQLGPFGGRGLEQKQLWRGSVAKAEPASSAAPPKTKEEKPKVDLKPKAEKDKEEETEQEGKSALSWQGGLGKHGMLKEPKAKDEIPKALTYLGGMQDPHKAVVKLPTLKSQNVNLWERWRKFAVQNPDILEVAETYGTEACQFNEELLCKWRAELCELWGVDLQGDRREHAEEYQTPVFHELLRGWRPRRCGSQLAQRRHTAGG